ncbi:hypothetical protein [Okeania sp. SIO2B9]|uniref:hypothetical protein n=1 Tax=Okeania sp. SIO2B9 TaxID=2607782 RepID=UPI00142CE695|nr:hypothetical protein [Okeania sp. SIO2B9]NES91553.1 hypothetical protein [Okeania sp. SIO2B9]
MYIFRYPVVPCFSPKILSIAKLFFLVPYRSLFTINKLELGLAILCPRKQNKDIFREKYLDTLCDRGFKVYTEIYL